MGNKSPSVDRKLSLPFIQAVDNGVDSSSLEVFTQQLNLLREINISRETNKSSAEIIDQKDEKESKILFKYCNDIYHSVRILADRIASPTFNANEYEFTVAVLNALMRLYTYPLTAKKTLIPNLASLIRFLDVKKETIFSNAIMVFHLGFRSYLDESFRLNIYIQLEKLGYFNISLIFVMQHYSNVNMNYCSVLILQDILWILRRQSSFPNTMMLQFKIRQLLRQSSVLMNLFELSRHPVAAVQQLSSLILNEVLKSSDKTSCVSIQNLSQSHGAVLWTFYRFVTYLLAFMEQKGSRDISFKTTSTTGIPPGATSTSTEYCPAGTQRLRLILPQEYQEMLEHHLPLPEEPSELSHCLEVTGQLLMKLCMGNANNTQLILRAIPEGMSIFLFPQATSSGSTDSSIPESISDYAEKMECWLRWHVLLAALGQRVESLRVVWNRQALEHLRVQLRANIIGLDRLRELRYEIWDPLTVGISYPMLDALVPVKGIFLRILLQDLEADHAAFPSAATATSTSTSGYDKSGSNDNNVLLTQSEFLEVSLQILDRAILCSSKLDNGRKGTTCEAEADQQEQEEEEEIILLCLRALLLLHQRWPEETRPGIPVGGLLLLLKAGIHRCALGGQACAALHRNTPRDVSPSQQQSSYTTPSPSPSSVLWLQRSLSLLRVRLSGCTRSDLQLVEGLGGLRLLLRLLTDRLLLPLLRGAGDSSIEGDEEAGRTEDFRLSSSGSGSMLHTTLSLLLELAVQSFHIASHLCLNTNLALLVEAMGQLGGIGYWEVLSGGKGKMRSSYKAMEMMSALLRRLLVISPFSIYRQAVSMGLVQVLLLGSLDAEGRGVLGQSASGLLLDLLALDLQDRVASTGSGSGSGSGRGASDVHESGVSQSEGGQAVSVVSDFLRFLPLQMFRVALCSTPDEFRAIYNQDYSHPAPFAVANATSTATATTDVCCDLVWNDTVRTRSRRLVFDSLCHTYPYLTELVFDSENDITTITPSAAITRTTSNAGLESPSSSTCDPEKQPQICGIFLRRLLLPEIPPRFKFCSPVDIYRLSDLLSSHLAGEEEEEVGVQPQLQEEKSGERRGVVSSAHCCCLSTVTLGSRVRGRDAATSGRGWRPPQSPPPQAMKDLGLTCVGCNRSYHSLEVTERDALLLLGLLALQQLPRQLVVSEKPTPPLKRLPNMHTPSTIPVEPVVVMLESQYLRIVAKLHRYLQVMKMRYEQASTATNSSTTSCTPSVVSVTVQRGSSPEILHVMDDLLTRIEGVSMKVMTENDKAGVVPVTAAAAAANQRSWGKVPGSSNCIPSSTPVSASGSGSGVLRPISCCLLAISQIVTETALSGVSITNDTRHLHSSGSSGSDRAKSSGGPATKPDDDPMATMQNNGSHSPILQEVLPLILQILNLCLSNMVTEEASKEEEASPELDAAAETRGDAKPAACHPGKNGSGRSCGHTGTGAVVVESARTSAVALALLAHLATVVRDWLQWKQREAAEVRSAGSGAGSGSGSGGEESLLETMNPKGEFITTLSSKEWIDCLCAYCSSSIALISPRSTFSASVVLQSILLCAYPRSLDVIDKLTEAGFPASLVDTMVSLVCAPPVVSSKKQPPMLRSSSLYESGTPKTPSHPGEGKPRTMSLRSQSSSSISFFPASSGGGAVTPKDILKHLQSELAAELAMDTNSTAAAVETGGAEGSGSGSGSTGGTVRHAAAVECAVLLRLLVCHGVLSGGEIMGFLGEPLPKYLACFLTTPLLHTLLTDPEQGLSILGTVTPIRRPVAIWSADMTGTLRSAIARDLALIHSKNIRQPTTNTASTAATTSGDLWDMATSSKRLTDLYPAIRDEVTVEGIYISMLLEPHNEDDIGVRSLPRFVESLQASLATSKKVFEHVKSSPSELRKVGRRDALVAQLAVKQRVLENIMKKHPELGYSNLSVDWED